MKLGGEPVGSATRGRQGPGPGAWGRRAISWSGLALAALVLVGGLPLWLALALCGDLLGALRGRGAALALTRGLVVLTCFTLAEVWGVGMATAHLLRGPWMSDEAWTEAHYRLQRRWAGGLVDAAARLYGWRIHQEGEEVLDGRPMLLLMRHTSAGDGLMAVRFVNVAHGYRLRFVLKRELLWDPCLDLVGNRIPNAFVRRDGTDSAAEVARVGALARDLGRGEGVMLFVEGTRYTPERHARALARLEREGPPDLLERARRLRCSLPPRPGGVLGLLEQNPGLDIVICGHVGLESVRRLPDFLRGALVGTELHLRFWRYPAAELPGDPEARVRWLYDRWAELDAWAWERLSARPQATG